MDRWVRLTPRRLEVSCARCGRLAATLVLLPAEHDVEKALELGPFAGDDRLRREGFLGTMTMIRGAADLLAVFDAVASGDFAHADSLESDAVSFHCPECNRVYCDRCWRVEPPVFDDGFYDYTEAVCPNGHRHIVGD
jgi:hypothetical protein